jgi:5'-nucleotidase (lipoprotein e(P4) family)
MHGKLYSVSVLAVIAALLTGCASAPANAPSTAVTPDPDEAFHDALHWSRNAAEHRAIFEQTFALATRRIDELSQGRLAGTWGVSVDADETLIDNSPFEVEITRRGETFNSENWSQWVERRAAPALPGAAAFTAHVQQLGGIVAVVTNRGTLACAATADNLRRVQIPFDIVLCREENREKEPRWDALVAGSASDWPEAQVHGNDRIPPVDILLWVGDNVGDFPDQDQEIRHNEAPLTEFGTRFFALPNPMYGSWEENPKP